MYKKRSVYNRSFINVFDSDTYFYGYFTLFYCFGCTILCKLLPYLQIWFMVFLFNFCYVNSAIQIIKTNVGEDLASYAYIPYPDGFNKSNSYCIGFVTSISGSWRCGFGIVSEQARLFVSFLDNRIGIYNENSALKGTEIKIIIGKDK